MKSPIGDKQMDCKEAAERSTDYLENALDEALHRNFKMHLASCARCTGYLQQLKTTIEATRRVKYDGIAQDTQAELLDIFRVWKDRR